ncbi:hypothetical protein RRG08_043165 [Elysia crispata]|uniref:Uncharacterized protein n=1 Tax=Elysia crispata TaxID=231223 RepID=A0AAE0ZIJ0_9GAST|nr:hypothetical protein RRG08_043165 [Elysia crispata]
MRSQAGGLELYNIGGARVLPLVFGVQHESEWGSQSLLPLGVQECGLVRSVLLASVVWFGAFCSLVWFGAVRSALLAHTPQLFRLVWIYCCRCEQFSKGVTIFKLSIHAKSSFTKNPREKMIWS